MSKPRPYRVYYDCFVQPSFCVSATTACTAAHRRVVRGDNNSASVWRGNQRVASIYRDTYNVIVTCVHSHAHFDYELSALRPVSQDHLPTQADIGSAGAGSVVPLRLATGGGVSRQ